MNKEQIIEELSKLGDSIEVIFSEPRKLKDIIEKNLPVLEGKESLIVWFRHEEIHYDILNEVVKIQSAKMAKRGYTIVANHPSNPDSVPLLPNFDKCGILKVQKL